MKVEIELKDLQEYFLFDEDGETVNVSQVFTEWVLNEIVTRVYCSIIGSDAKKTLHERIDKLIAENKDYIIEQSIQQVTETMLRKKAIANEIPKKSEINNINKEWESYFVELIDEAIRKKFR